MRLSDIDSEPPDPRACRRHPSTDIAPGAKMSAEHLHVLVTFKPRATPAIRNSQDGKVSRAVAVRPEDKSKRLVD